MRGQSTTLHWEEDEIPGPDVSKRETLLLLAKMTSNAYIEPNTDGWYNLTDEWGILRTSAARTGGWEPDNDGFRGYIFATDDNSTVVLSIKGTSAQWVDKGPTTGKDKTNDNLLFGCCCARINWSWTTVCDCYRGGWKCNQDCLEDALIEESLFYPIGTRTNGRTRLHLPTPPSTHHITHVWNTADPIAMGTCNGVLSSCALGGYAMESRCHLGNIIEYDTVTNLSWSVDVRTHAIAQLVDKVLSEPWAAAEELGREVPPMKRQDDCVYRKSSAVGNNHYY
ncbi:hypothetical protein BJV77DRAFT_963908 [Russula vinacea]|nr:hypothetical protein BJV77DRAFT_963908 [Russula vinacea]